jgi:hypothetical protein
MRTAAPPLPVHEQRKEAPMAAKNPQTMAKRARELAVKERRERKRAKKAEAAAQRAEAATADRTVEE